MRRIGLRKSTTKLIFMIKYYCCMGKSKSKETADLQIGNGVLRRNFRFIPYPIYFVTDSSEEIWCFCSIDRQF